MTENSSLKKFIDKLMTDSKLMEEFKAVANEGSLEKAYHFALSRSDGGFTREEFESFLSKLMASYEYAKEQLDDGSLENIAGGVVDLSSNDFWEKVLKGKKSEEDKAKAIDEKITMIYGKELDLKKKENMGNLVAKGVGAGNHVVNLITTLGNIFLSCKDMKLKRQKYEAQELQRECDHLNFLLKKQELIDQARSEGINLVLD